MSNIGQNIKNRRIELGLTADQLAERLNKSRATIYRYESTDADNMPIGILEPLSKALSTTPAELMGWNDGAVKVTTNITFDNNSPMHALTQAYIRRPALVQDEIIKRLEGLDVTFSKKVSKLLQASGDINGFMQGTGLPFATVGKFMQGETVLTTPTEAERIATYFHANVVDLFFDDATPDKTTAAPEPTKTQQDEAVDAPEPCPPVMSDRCKEVFRFINQKSKKNIKILISLADYKKILLDERVDKVIKEAIDAIESRSFAFENEFDATPYYKAIAKEILDTPDFIETYADGSAAGLEDLIDTISK